MAKINYTEFHRLIEIVVKLNSVLDKDITNRTYHTRDRLKKLRDESREWIEENYEKNGINEYYLKELENY